ncbi:hypothetical protein Q4Q52_19565 [Shewanella sp. SP1S2-4]|uniref:hypothetical protein n=1 Tax=Shewanella sp. SP1S2-4 TaxID=3063537 RepID=UPI0028908ECA|nr:hypothetical protein [Shewanella sp. SP1S2-4]MDT3321935.1 hypothetical protein [Shewanella sp. SP1S2-4]
MNVKEYFVGLNNNIAEIIETSFESKNGNDLSDMFQFVDELSIWESILNKTTDTTLLISAIKEFELGFQAVLSGQYRYAFIAQRYFIEQITRFIYLSTNELHLRHWKLGIRDVSWGSLIDNENGVFSKVFIRAFFQGIEDEGGNFISLSSKMYRESSEFVHGNFDKINILPEKIAFQGDMLERWLEYMETGKLIAMFLLFMRFSKDLDASDLAKLEAMASDELCGIDGFECLFQ